MLPLVKGLVVVFTVHDSCLPLPFCLICKRDEACDELSRAARLFGFVSFTLGFSAFVRRGVKSSVIKLVWVEITRADEPANGGAIVGGRAFSTGAPVSLGVCSRLPFRLAKLREVSFVHAKARLHLRRFSGVILPHRGCQSVRRSAPRGQSRLC